MRIATLAAAVLLAATAGCGSDNGLHLAKVQGKVLYKGAPVTFGTIMFEPEGGAGPSAVGSIGSDGGFVLSTENAGDGAVVGPHRVAIMGMDESSGDAAAALPDPETSPQDFMVAKSKAGMASSRTKKAETYTDASGKVVRITIPAHLASTGTSNLKTVVAAGSNVVEISIDEDGAAKISP